MYGYTAVLAAYRAHAHKLIAAAQPEAQRARLAREHGECVLRNRAKLLVVRLEQTCDDAARRRILNATFLGA
jgi:hypothetical protein